MCVFNYLLGSLRHFTISGVGGVCMAAFPRCCSSLSSLLSSLLLLFIELADEDMAECARRVRFGDNKGFISVGAM